MWNNVVVGQRLDFGLLGAELPSRRMRRQKSRWLLRMGWQCVREIAPFVWRTARRVGAVVLDYGSGGRRQSVFRQEIVASQTGRRFVLGLWYWLRWSGTLLVLPNVSVYKQQAISKALPLGASLPPSPWEVVRSLDLCDKDDGTLEPGPSLRKTKLCPCGNIPPLAPRIKPCVPLSDAESGVGDVPTDRGLLNLRT